MNLLLSYNWLKEYLSTKESASDFAKKISLSGPSVDHINRFTPSFENVIVAQIKKIQPHPNAEKLRVCQADTGKETLQIVCGAPNIEVGQKVPLAMVGSKVGNMKIAKAELRGVESFGMMCSQKELGLGEDQAGIFILPDYVRTGLSLEKVIPIEDYVFDLEVTANRPDAMSIIGVAREAAAILKSKFLYREPKPNLKVKKELKLSVLVKEPKLCRRYQAIVMTNIKAESSPLWMQARLLSAGMRPINNLADITNYILLEFGQPMHVFDYDKLKGNEINVRSAKKGERIQALDGKTYELNQGNLVIADSGSPVAIAGVMGGEFSAAGLETKNIVLESANFNPVSVRKTARVLNLHSSSSNLYEKNPHPNGTESALLRAVELVMELAGGQIASPVFDQRSEKFKNKEIALNCENVEKVLGAEIKKTEIREILESLGFKVRENKVTVPWWRDHDISGEHDLIEEVARIYGYHRLPSKLPQGEIPAGVGNAPEFEREDQSRDVISSLGFAESCNYSFVSEKIIKNCGLSLGIKINNPLSSDFEYMRTSLAPGILQNLAENEGFFPAMKIFELSKVYLEKKDDLPEEKTSLVLACLAKEGSFLEIKGALSVWAEKIHLKNLHFEISGQKSFWSKGKTLAIKAGEEELGHLGLVDQEVLYLFGLKKETALAEMDFEKIIVLAEDFPSYAPIAKFPAIELDLSLEVEENVLYQEIREKIEKTDDLIKKVSFLSVFQGGKMEKGKKALAVRLTYRDDEKTLTLSEAQAVQDKVVFALKKEYNISVR